MLKPLQDAYGQVLIAMHKGLAQAEIVEREDGFITTSAFGKELYFGTIRQWNKEERQAIKYARGRVLDIGCGAGRVALYLQKKGHDSLSIDNSPLAIKLCKERGVIHTKCMSILEIDKSLGSFDTIVMFGNNFGLFSNAKRAKMLLKRFHKMTPDSARLLVGSADPYRTTLKTHLLYHQSNRRRGRMSGQIKLRIRYNEFCTPWYDYLMVSIDEMSQLLKPTGWQIKHIFDSQEFTYTAVIEKA